MSRRQLCNARTCRPAALRPAALRPAALRPAALRPAGASRGPVLRRGSAPQGANRRPETVASPGGWCERSRRGSGLPCWEFRVSPLAGEACPRDTCEGSVAYRPLRGFDRLGRVSARTLTRLLARQVLGPAGFPQCGERAVTTRSTPRRSRVTSISSYQPPARSSASHGACPSATSTTRYPPGRSAPCASAASRS